MIEWTVDTLLAMTVLMAIVLAIRAPVTRLFGAHLAYALWLLPAARLFMPALSETVVIPASHNAAPAGVSAAAAPVLAVATESSSAFDWTPIVLALWLGGALSLSDRRYRVAAGARKSAAAAQVAAE